MTEHEKYQEHIRHTHDAFCKTVIRHAAIDAARSIRSRRKREISLEYYFFITHKQKLPLNSRHPHGLILFQYLLCLLNN